MIYCVHPDTYPKNGEYIEELMYIDENLFDWRIARVENGLYVIYLGHEYFSETTFECEMPDGSYISIINTNCIFIQNTEFETFCEVRDLIKLGYTDDIWEAFTELFTERLIHDDRLLESEVKN